MLIIQGDDLTFAELLVKSVKLNTEILLMPTIQTNVGICSHCNLLMCFSC